MSCRRSLGNFVDLLGQPARHGLAVAPRLAPLGSPIELEHRLQRIGSTKEVTMNRRIGRWIQIGLFTALPLGTAFAQGDNPPMGASDSTDAQKKANDVTDHVPTEMPGNSATPAPSDTDKLDTQSDVNKLDDANKLEEPNKLTDPNKLDDTNIKPKKAPEPTK
jgi:hypothetical protein